MFKPPLQAVNLKTAEQLLPCFRANRPVDTRVEKAVRVAEGDATLRSHLEVQKNWDSQLASVIHSIEPPEDLRRRLSSFAPGEPDIRRPLRSQMVQTGMLAVLLGVFILIGLTAFVIWDRKQNFHGRETVEHLLSITRNMSGAEFEPVQAQAWQLGDWFYMRGFEGFALPAELAQLHAVGSRLFRYGGQTVAQIAVDERNCLVYVFKAAGFSIDLPEENEWHLLEHDGWAGAIRRQGDTCTMIAFRGSRSEMRDFLRTLRKE